MEVSTREEFDKWKRKCFVHSELHDISATIYIVTSITLFYIQILLTGVTSSLIFITDVNNCSTSLNIVSGVLSVVGGLLTIVIKNFSINEKGSLHRQTSQKYIKLISDIDLHQVDPEYDVTSNVTFLQGVSEEYIELKKHDYVICSIFLLERRHRCKLNELLYPSITRHVENSDNSFFVFNQTSKTTPALPRMTELSQSIRFIDDT